MRVFVRVLPYLRRYRGGLIAGFALILVSNAFADGQTVVTPRSQIDATQQPARMFKFDAGVSLDEIVRAVNQVGAAPGDLVAILEALREVGALRAQLLVI